MLGSVITESRRVRQSGSTCWTARPAVSSRTSVSAIRMRRPSCLRQEIADAASHEIDHVFARRRGRRKARGFAHRALGPIGVAAPQLCERADIGDRIVHRLCLAGIGGDGGALPPRLSVRSGRGRRAAARRSRLVSQRRDWCPAPSPRCGSHRGYRFRRSRRALRSAPRKPATGTDEARIARMISRIDVSSPPGVSICRMIRLTLRSLAR